MSLSRSMSRLAKGSISQNLSAINYGGVLTPITSSPIARTSVIVLFWGGVGLVAYTIVWSLINVAIEARNEVVLETTYTNRSDFVSRLHTPLLQFALAIGLFVCLFLTAKYALPFWLGLASRGVSAPGTLMALGLVAGAVAGMAGNAYFLMLLGQLVFWVG